MTDWNEWVPGAWISQVPCARCRMVWREHHEGDPDSLFRDGHLYVWPKGIDPSSNAIKGWLHRTWRGDFDAPLPPPRERYRIRVASGLNEYEVAAEIGVPGATVMEYEKNGPRRFGVRTDRRTPSGKVREAYSQLLRDLAEKLEEGR